MLKMQIKRIRLRCRYCGSLIMHGGGRAGKRLIEIRCPFCNSINFKSEMEPVKVAVKIEHLYGKRVTVVKERG